MRSRFCWSGRHGRGGRRWLAGLTTLVLTELLAIPGHAQQAARTASLVFDGATIVDVESGELVPAQRVVVAGNRIQAVGGEDAVAVPSGAQVVEARGKYIIPGLWDMHVHLDAPSNASRRALRRASEEQAFFSLFIASGITGIRDAWSVAPLDTLLQWRREILAGTRVGPPRQLLAGATFGQHYPTGDSAVVARIVDSLKAEGADFLKVYPYTPTVAAAARRAGILFGGHVKEGGDPIGPSDSGMTILDHANSGSLDSLCVFRPPASLEQCRAVAERFRRNGTWWVPTLTVFPGVVAVKNPRDGGIYTLTRGQYIADSILLRLSTKFWWDTTFSHNWLREGRPRASGPGSPSDSLGLLYFARRAGMPILAGTDVNHEWKRGKLGRLLPGLTLHAELAIYVAEGLTPLEALQSATLNPAKMLQGTDSLGTVAPGKLADLVLLDADPLADITNITAIRAVVANGRYFDRVALDSLVLEVQARGP